ncbi:MAG: tRNA (adenosine(37)-N6)-threonylcarbamoyltransferase complex dimerization subunit type 1 TsaB [Pseudomonadota bacterium]
MQAGRTWLLIDCAGKCAQAGLHDAQGKIHQLRHDTMHGYAILLMPMIAELLAEHATTKNDLDGIIVTCGPGSFTGLRVSIACARGLALGLGIPCIGVGSFACYAAAIPIKMGARLSVLIDTRRGDFFTQSFHAGAAGWQETGPITILDADGLAPALENIDIITGDAPLPPFADARPQAHNDLAVIPILSRTAPLAPLPIYARPAQTNTAK